jgi:hypothetical protein
MNKYHNPTKASVLYALPFSTHFSLVEYILGCSFRLPRGLDKRRASVQISAVTSYDVDCLYHPLLSDQKLVEDIELVE